MAARLHARGGSSRGPRRGRRLAQPPVWNILRRRQRLHDGRRGGFGLLRAARPGEPGRRGHRDRALFPRVCRMGRERRRDARRGPCRSRDVSAGHRCHRVGDHRPDGGGHHRLAQQPHGRRLSARVARGPRRRPRAGERPKGRTRLPDLGRALPRDLLWCRGPLGSAGLRPYGRVLFVFQEPVAAWRARGMGARARHHAGVRARHGGDRRSGALPRIRRSGAVPARRHRLRRRARRRRVLCPQPSRADRGPVCLRVRLRRASGRVLPVGSSARARRARLCASAPALELLPVPSDSFGVPGWVRVGYCVDRAVIERSLPAWRALAETYRDSEGER